MVFDRFELNTMQWYICAWYSVIKHKAGEKKAGRNFFLSYSVAIDREIADIVHHDKIERNTCIAYGLVAIVNGIVGVIIVIGDVW